MRVLGVLGLGKNPGACFLDGGRLVACAEEERFNREKTSMGRWPVESIRYCLAAGGAALPEVDRVAVAWGLDKYPAAMAELFRRLDQRYPKKGSTYRDTEAQILRRYTPEHYVGELAKALQAARLGRLPRDRTVWFEHHRCHAAMAFYSSGFARAVAVVVDGSGEDEATTVWRCGPRGLDKLESVPLPDSLGRVYASLTEYLGFKAYSDEGKVMGLAPYGSFDRDVVDQLDRVLHVEDDGRYTVNPDFLYYGAHSYHPRFTDELVELLGPPRLPRTRNEPIEARHRNIAWAVQDLLERAVVGIVRRAVRAAGIGQVCVSGGVAMNCKMNGVLAGLPEVQDLFVHPASHDGGACIGAAMLAELGGGGAPRFAPLDHAYYGPGYEAAAIERLLHYAKVPYRRLEDVAPVVADHLVQGKVVALFQGRMEMGARALGNRSILASPLTPDTKALLNNQVKHREDWRPFCPSILVEEAGRYFDPLPNPWYMVVATKAKPEAAQDMPAAVHVDGTARPQLVRPETNPVFWRIIDEFRRRTGVPAVINTSLNTMGEPIINRPEEALRCFYSTGIDTLVLENFVLAKPASAAR
jgi:carbamoyltransferase